MVGVNDSVAAAALDQPAVGGVRGRAGDQEVVVDGSLVLSRKPDDLPAFNRELVRAITSGTEATAGRTSAGERT